MALEIGEVDLVGRVIIIIEVVGGEMKKGGADRMA